MTNIQGNSIEDIISKWEYLRTNLTDSFPSESAVKYLDDGWVKKALDESDKIM